MAPIDDPAWTSRAPTAFGLLLAAGIWCLSWLPTGPGPQGGNFPPAADFLLAAVGMAGTVLTMFAVVRGWMRRRDRDEYSAR
jgi:hypothetical protein